MESPDLAQKNQQILIVPGTNSDGLPSHRTSAPTSRGPVVMNLRRVLLVDDNPEFLAVSREFLEAHGEVEVVGTATSAQEAFALIESAQPSMLITDLVMPSINGLELTQQVKKRWPHICVIVLTMHNTARHRDAAINAGADAFVTKANLDTDLIPAIIDLQNRQDRPS
jgi:DNA-binding NarL/FixJ family response regulator